MPVDDERETGFAAIAAASKATDAGLVEEDDLLEEGVMSEVTGVVVGQRHAPEVAGKDVEDPGMGPEGVRLLDCFADGRYDALEIRDRNVDTVEDVGKLSEGVPARRDRLAGEVGEHDIAGEGERHLVGRVALQGNQHRGHQHGQAQRRAREP